MRYLVALALVVVASSAVAEQAFSVLGSFADRDSAVAEGERISREVGVEVMLLESLVGTQVMHRLLLSQDRIEVDTDLLNQQLRAAGIENTWTLRLPDELPFMETLFGYFGVEEELALYGSDPVITEADSFVDHSTDVYLVAGSFESGERAQKFLDQLQFITYGKSIVRKSLDDGMYHRVVIGPIDRGSEDGVRLELELAGVLNTFVLRDTPEPEKNAAASAAGVPVRKMPENAEPEYTTDFNLATLKKKPGAGLIPATKPANPGRWRADVATELRFFNDPGFNDLEEFHPSISVEAEYYKTWNDGDDIFAFVPFIRWDAEDEERSHFDIRELTWVHVEDSWELRTGIRKVFWGVTESQHLVDIINQTDNVENPDGEEKLGQPMINLSLIRDWGIVDLYLLTGFRERNFRGENGRPRLPLLVDEGDPVYESSAEEYRTDVAVRWSHYIGDLEFGLSHFSGTSREPRFEVRLETDVNGVPIDGGLVPVYDVIDQTGIDAQYFVGDWAWKLEAITRSGQGYRFTAATFGFEKTFVGVFGTRSDLGIVAEYLYDNRGEGAPVLGEDDVALGFRWTVNNPADTSALLVWLYDVDSDEYLMTLEASSRIGSRWKLVVEASIFDVKETSDNSLGAILNAFNDPDSELGLFQDEDFLKLELIRYF